MSEREFRELARRLEEDKAAVRWEAWQASGNPEHREAARQHRLDAGSIDLVIVDARRRSGKGKAA